MKNNYHYAQLKITEEMTEEFKNSEGKLGWIRLRGDMVLPFLLAYHKTFPNSAPLTVLEDGPYDKDSATIKE